MSATKSLVTTPAEAEQTCAAAVGAIERLREVIERETALVQRGELRHAAALGAAKAAFAGELFTCGERVKAHAGFLLQAAPAGCAALKRVEQAFRAVLQRNMIAIATAHAVSEGIVRRLSGDLAKKASPQVYGSSGRAVAPNPKRALPLAVSRTL
jgi:hypothetical protein